MNEMQSRKLKRKVLIAFALLFVVMFAARQVFADLSDAHWHVDNRDKDIVEIVNMNKASCRIYGFSRDTGSLKCIRLNVSRLDDERILVYGESSFAVFFDGVEQKAKFVSFDATEVNASDNAKAKRGSDVLAIATSRYRLPEANVDIAIEYRFRRDNEVEVDFIATASTKMPADANVSISYPVRNDYEINDQRRDVYKIRLSRAQDDRKTPLYFRSRSSLGMKNAKNMSVVVSEKDNALSPCHNRVITLSSSLQDPIRAKDCLNTTVEQWLYSFRFSIPLRLSWFDGILEAL